MGSLIEYYNQYNEDERLFKTNANTLEFITTITKLEPLIKKGDKIIELGAATGNYSFYYSERGHEVVALDIVPEHIRIINKKIEEKGIQNMGTYLGSAADLSAFQNESFDVVLCLGPMYHLISPEDQLSCIKEARRVLKKEGILAVAYINKHYILANTMFKNKKYLREEFVTKILDNGFLASDDKDNFWVESVFFTPREIESLIDGVGFQKIENIATDGLGRLFSEKINNLTEEEFKVFTDYHLKSCSDETLLGYSNHGLYIAKKI